MSVKRQLANGLQFFPLDVANDLDNEWHMQKEIKTVSAAVEALGGKDKVMSLLGVSRYALRYWIYEGHQFPAAEYVRVSRALTRAGYTASLSLFSFRGLTASAKRRK